MKNLICFFILNLLFGFNAFATNTDPQDFCKNIFNHLRLKPGLIQKFAMPIDSNEVEYSGFKVSGGWKPQELNQNYLYIIDESGDLWISSDFVPGSSTKFIATHRSLYNQKQKSNSAKVVAAGQIMVKNGVISSIDNQSGTFRGDESNLRFAHHIISTMMNIKVPDEVLLIDLSKNGKSPLEVHESRINLLKKFHEPEFLNTRNQWEPILKRLHEIYPDPASPGDYNNKLIEDIWDYQLSKGKTYNKNLMRLPGYLASFSESFDHLVNVAVKYPNQSKEVLNELIFFLEAKQKQK